MEIKKQIFSKNGLIFSLIAMLFGANGYDLYQDTYQTPTVEKEIVEEVVPDSLVFGAETQTARLWKVKAKMKAQRSAFVDLFDVQFFFGSPPTTKLIDHVFTLIKYKKGPYVYGVDMKVLEVVESEQIK